MSIEKTVSEIAEILGVSRQAVNNRVKQLPEEDLEKIEKELEEEIVQTENIINKQTNIYPNEDYIEVEVIYEVLENIGSKDKIIF